MNVALIVFTDGRAECLERTLESFHLNVQDQDLITYRLIVNDQPDPTYARWIDQRWVFDQQLTTRRRRGYAGAIHEAWHEIRRQVDYFREIDYVLHLEDDFIFQRPVPLADMIEVLANNPHLVQMALKRQPWNDTEVAAGDLIYVSPEDYVDCFDSKGHWWLEHRRFFTTNPNVYPKNLTRLGWPLASNSEGMFSERALIGTNRSAYWGRRNDEPWVHHIGNTRVGTGY